MLQNDVNENHGYLYVLIRKDLSPQQIAVQACHASIEIARNYITPQEEHPSVIICEIKNEEKLFSLINYLKSHNIKFKEFREPDRGNELTAIATELLFGEERIPMKRFQLLKFKEIK